MLLPPQSKLQINLFCSVMRTEPAMHLAQMVAAAAAQLAAAFVGEPAAAAASSLLLLSGEPSGSASMLSVKVNGLHQTLHDS
jgi:hypothetical protein